MSGKGSFAQAGRGLVAGVGLIVAVASASGMLLDRLFVPGEGPIGPSTYVILSAPLVSLPLALVIWSAVRKSWPSFAFTFIFTVLAASFIDALLWAGLGQFLLAP